MTTHSAKRIVIIGGGPAGYEAALVGARYGADITLIEDNGLGGSAVIDDCVPSKSFIAGANVKTDLRRAEDMGLSMKLAEDAAGAGSTRLVTALGNSRMIFIVRSNAPGFGLSQVEALLMTII